MFEDPLFHRLAESTACTPPRPEHNPLGYSMSTVTFSYYGFKLFHAYTLPRGKGR